MNKKKGFTLIELLAVIVILAIIALITTPLIMNIINDAKKGAFLDSSYGIIKAAENGIARTLIREKEIEETIYTFDNGIKTLESGNIVLEYKGSSPEYGSITINQEGIAISFYSNGWCATKGYDDNDIILNKVSKKDDCSHLANESVLMVEPSSGESGMYLNGPIAKNKIERISFTNTNVVPSNVIGSWDVSINQDELVMAWYTDNDSNDLYELTIGGNGKVYSNPNSSTLFSYFVNLKSIDFTNFDTSKVINMYGMFYGTISLENLDLRNFNTSKVTNMSNMFAAEEESLLANLDISTFDTSKVTDMSYMFAAETQLTTLDFTTFDTSNVTDMSYMFGWASFTNINLSSFNTSKVTNMNGMFQHAINLQTLDLGNFNTSQVTKMNSMFSDTNKLLTLNLKNATFESVSNYTNIFVNTKQGINIYTKNSTTRSWIQSRLSDSGITGTVTIAT